MFVLVVGPKAASATVDLNESGCFILKYATDNAKDAEVLIMMAFCTSMVSLKLAMMTIAAKYQLHIL